LSPPRNRDVPTTTVSPMSMLKFVSITLRPPSGARRISPESKAARRSLRFSISAAVLITAASLSPRRCFTAAKPPCRRLRR
jgi:hypothetical protein